MQRSAQPSPYCQKPGTRIRTYARPTLVDLDNTAGCAMCIDGSARLAKFVGWPRAGRVCSTTVRCCLTARRRRLVSTRTTKRQDACCRGAISARCGDEAARPHPDHSTRGVSVSRDRNSVMYPRMSYSRPAGVPGFAPGMRFAPCQCCSQAIRRCRSIFNAKNHASARIRTADLGIPKGIYECHALPLSHKGRR